MGLKKKENRAAGKYLYSGIDCPSFIKQQYCSNAQSYQASCALMKLSIEYPQHRLLSWAI